MRALWVLLALVAGVGLGVGAYLALGPSLPHATPLPVASSAAALGAAPLAADPSASAAPSSAAPAEPSASAAPVAPAEATAEPEAAAPAEPAASPEEVSACLRGLFSDDAWLTKKPKLGFVCESPKPKDVASRLRVALVDAGGGHVSDSMKEWSQLGFYELAVVAALRGRCCGEVAAFEALEASEGCGSVAEALGAIARASVKEAPPDAVDAAVDGFDAAIRCVLKSKRGPVHGYTKVLPGEASVFRKIHARTRGS